MARRVNNNLFLEEWLRTVSGSSNLLVKQNSGPSARSIIQAWSEIRESLQTRKFDTGYLDALRALVSSESTIHVADPQAKLLISTLALKDSESYTLVLRLLYVWIRKSFRPSQTLIGSAVEAIRGVVADRRNLQPELIAQSVLLCGAFACVPSLSKELKVLSLELICKLLEEEYSLVGSQEELVPLLLAGIGYALSSSSLDVHYIRVLDSLFGVWLKENGPRGSVTHGLMILHLIEWVMSGYIKSNNVEKMSLFVNMVIESSKENYAVFSVLMAAAGVLRASSGAQNVTILRNFAEKRIESIAELLLSNGNVKLQTTQRVVLLKCFAIALARCGSVSSSPPLLLCLASALLTQVFPLGVIYESFSGNRPRLNWVKEYFSDVLFKESGAVTGAFCNQYVSASEENKSIVENMIWVFCQNLYLQHRQIAMLLRGVDDTLLGDIEKIAESSFLMVVVFALAVMKNKQLLLSQERKMETAVKILVSFSCVEYFRHIRLPEYMETIREVIRCVQENDATCALFAESIPAYDSLTNPKGLGIEYEWSRDDVQTCRILFYLRVIPTCIGRLSASAFRRVVASTMFLYIGHPSRKVARASHTLFVAFLSSTKEPEEEDERNQLKEQLVFYYIQRSLELYPEITPFEGLASGVAALVRHLPAGSPAIFYSIHSLVEKVSAFNSDDVLLQGRKTNNPGNQILELLLRLVSLVDIQVLPYIMKSLAQLIIKLPKERQDMVLGDLYGQVAESDDVIRKPSLVSWLQSVNYLCSSNNSASEPIVIETSNQLAARL